MQISAGGKAWLKNQRLAELEAQLDPARFVRDAPLVHRQPGARSSRIEPAGKDSHVRAC